MKKYKENNSRLPIVLGIKKFPEDNFWDYKDYRDNHMWKLLIKLARKRGIKVYVKEFGSISKYFIRGRYVRNGSIDVILINQELPNWYKPITLAHELAHYVLHREQSINEIYSNITGIYPSYKNSMLEGPIKDIIKNKQEQEADEYGKRLRSYLKAKYLSHKNEKEAPPAKVKRLP